MVDIYKVYVAALVPVYGISVLVLNPTYKGVPIKCNRSHPRYVKLTGAACPWVAFCRRRHDGKWMVDFDVSTFEHSHGPCKEILADPAWRPTVHNADARAVLGMSPLPRKSTNKKQAFSEPVSDSVTVCWCALAKNLTGVDSSKQDRPPHKKARLSTTPSSPKAMPPPPVPIRPPTSVAPRPRPPSLSATPRRSPSAPPSYPSPVSPRTPQAQSARGVEVSGFDKPNSALAASSSSGPRNPSPFATWTRTDPPPPIQPYLPSPVRSVTTPVAPESPRGNDDPVELVSAFCAGLHPTLVSLAEPLVAAGVYSFDGLVALRVLGPHQLDHFLAQLRKVHSQRRAQSPFLPPLSNVHILLFAKHIKA